MRTHHRPNARARVGLTALALALGVGLAAPLTTAPAQAQGAQAVQSPTVAANVKHADAALARAVTQVRAGHLRRARNWLDVVRSHARAANVGALNLIGAPPVDPESDDPPGPPAVTKALKMDYRVGTGAAALFDGRAALGFISTVRRTVAVVQRRRAAVIDKVVGLPAEGARADYADGLTDTLPIFTREVTFFTRALSSFDLAPTARTALDRALARSRDAQAAMERAFGGGERPVVAGR